MKMRYRACAATMAVAAAIYVPVTGAQAQTEPAAADAPVIVVTGSFIRGTPEDAALPVDVFSSADLAQEGVNSPLDFIKDLPSVGSVLGDTNQFSTASQGFQGSGSINLRGLGPERTLVLLNGRRTIASPGDGFVDTNFIPLFALDRIELLKDGAAATYGSDAIGGVANFVTRQGWEGVEMAGDYEFINGSNDDYNASILVGQRFGEASFLAGFGYQHRSPLSTYERDFIRDVPYDVNPSGYSTLGNPGTYFPGLGVGVAGRAPTIPLAAPVLDGAIPGTCDATNGVTGSTGPGGTGVAVCRFTYVPFDNLVEKTNRYQAYGQFDVDLSDSLAFHAEALWARTRQTGRYSPSFPPIQGPTGAGSTYRFYVPDTNPGYAGFIAQSGLTGTAADPFTPGTPAANFGSYSAILLFRPLANGGNPLTGGGQIGEARLDAWRISAGLDWELSDSFRVASYGTFIRSTADRYVTDFVGQRLQAALNGFGGPACTGQTPGQNGCQYFNPFSNSFPTNLATGQANPGYIQGNDNDPALIDWLLVDNGTFQTEEQFVYDLIFSGETGIEIGGGGPIAYAFGAQYRESHFNSRSVDELSNLNENPCLVPGDMSCIGTATEGAGPFIFLGGTRPLSLAQEVYAAFAEVNIPIGNTFELTGAIRYEDYGGSVGSTINPKASLRWEALDWLVLRGSVGTTFRGPNPGQVAPTQVTSLAGIQAAANNFKAVDIFGNPVDLGPETAFTFNVGTVIDYGGFHFSVDYWYYDFSDRITTTPGQAIALAVASGGPAGNGTNLVNCSSPLVDLITFPGPCEQGTTSGLDIARVRTDWVNGPALKTSGLDFAIDYTTDLGPGVFSIGGQATHTLEYEFDDFIFRGVNLQAGYQADGFANFFRDPGTIAKWRANGYINYNVSGLNLRYAIQYIDGVTDDRCVNVNPCASTPEFGGTNFAAQIPSYTQHDFHVGYDLPFDFVEATLQFSIENFTNEDPSAARLEYGYNPFIGNPLGRVYRMGARVRF